MTPVPLMPSSSSPRYKQIFVVGVSEPERDADVEIPSGVLSGFIASSTPEGRVDEGRSGRHDGGTWVMECGCCGSMPSPVPSELYCSTRPAAAMALRYLPEVQQHLAPPFPVWKHMRRNLYRKKKRQKKSIFIYHTTFKKNESGRDFQRGQIWNDRSLKQKKNYGCHPLFTAQLLRKTNLAEIFSESRSGGTIAHNNEKRITAGIQ